MRKRQPELTLLVNREFDDPSAGYKSGRISERDTPDTSSNLSTRSAGTWDRSHFCTAWYRTPSLDAVACKPPALSTARSTPVFSGSDALSDSDVLASCDVLMSGNLQPIVAERQQPMRVRRSFTLQPMVANNKAEARLAFSRRLIAFLHNLGIPERKRISWLYERMRDGGKPLVSRETCRKWLRGLDLPDEANFEVLATKIGADAYNLRFGDTAIPSGFDSDTRELIEHFRKIESHQRQNILNIVKTAAALSAPSDAVATKPKQRRN
jgi:hypothetical protein